MQTEWRCLKHVFVQLSRLYYATEKIFYQPVTRSRPRLNRSKTLFLMTKNRISWDLLDSGKLLSCNRNLSETTGRIGVLKFSNKIYVNSIESVRTYITIFEPLLKSEFFILRTNRNLVTRDPVFQKILKFSFMCEDFKV